MVKVINQDIPAEMLDDYDASLHRAVEYLPGSGLYSVRHRVPFRLPHMRNDSLWSPSKAQRLVRKAFKRSCDCFGIQPQTGGAEPSGYGGYSRTWWYTQAGGSGLWYYDYFIQQTWGDMYANTPPKWCIIPTVIDTYVDEYYPNNNYASQTFMYIMKKTNENCIAYLKTNIPKPNYLSIRTFANLEYGCLTGIYDVPEEYDTGQITWNTRPTLGSLLGTVDLYGTVAAWYTFPVHEHQSVALVALQTRNFPIAFWSYDYTYAAHRPYFSM